MVEQKSIGSRAQVMHGNARKTSGGLTKSQLKYNKQGKIVSRKASALARKNNRLVKAGYTTQKGVFGSGKMKGGGLSAINLRSNLPVNAVTPHNKKINCKEELENLCQFNWQYEDNMIYQIINRLKEYIKRTDCTPNTLLTIPIHYMYINN